MKYIKLYENYSSLYWQVGDINDDERQEEKFNQNYLDDIQKRLKEGFSINRMGGGGWCRIEFKVCKPNCPNCLSLLVNKYIRDFYVDIFQLDDEYFDLEYLDAIHPDYQKYKFNSEYYRCDGIDGLIKFLEDEKIIN